jgi:hypothetical protein
MKGRGPIERSGGVVPSDTATPVNGAELTASEATAPVWAGNKVGLEIAHAVRNAALAASRPKP